MFVVRAPIAAVFDLEKVAERTQHAVHVGAAVLRVGEPSFGLALEAGGRSQVSCSLLLLTLLLALFPLL